MSTLYTCRNHTDDYDYCPICEIERLNARIKELEKPAADDGKPFLMIKHDGNYSMWLAQNIMKLAKECGIEVWHHKYGEEMSPRADEIISLCKKVQDMQREKDAKICEQVDVDGEGPDCWDWHSKDYAKAIRNSKGE
jgi:hypothetical protein